MLRLENSTQNGNMKKNVFFAPLFLYNLALIAHDATKSVNPSIFSMAGVPKTSTVVSSF